MASEQVSALSLTTLATPIPASATSRRAAYSPQPLLWHASARSALAASPLHQGRAQYVREEVGLTTATKGLDDLVEADFRRLQDNGVGESRDLEFKEQLGLTRFGGHPEAFARGALHGQNPTTLFA